MAKVYISSTYGDLKDYREAVYRTISRMGHDGIAMEDYVATGKYPPLEKCMADVAACDWYVGLFAWRYGYIRESGNPLKKSITELEYRKAQELEKPCFIFLLNEEAPWPRKQMDAVTGDGQRGVLIDQLRQELGQTKLVSFFKTPDELASLVSAAISNWEKEELKERSLQNEIKKATSSDYRTEETESKEESRKIVAANPIEEQIYQNSPYSLGKTMTSIERRHLEQQLKEQTEEYEAKTKELEFLRKAAQTADLRPKEAFKLSEQIEELELKRQEISQKLAKIAEKLDN